MMLVSIFMPTRGPISGLRKALTSIRQSATSPENVEILLRMDDDDTERLAMRGQLAHEFDAKTIVGPRGRGYIDMGVFVDDLARVATGKWAWLFDDDSWVEGDWQPRLRDVQQDATGGPAVHAEFYCLGGSTYRNGPHGGPVGLIVPMHLPKSIKNENPVDSQWLRFVQASKWEIRLLYGVRYCHDGRPR